MFGLGAGEVLLILVFALIFIGPKKLPELARSLGKGLNEFQKAKDELINQVQNDSSEPHDNETLTGVANSEDPSKEASKEEPQQANV